ncbi:MAG: Brp/Blh family beta-carotene 15,15'-dioxygenase, partial [Halobacteria archaeon]|nr:Brp/Blh family beta-carotene 15,15'-dioxygenase [Halobacteria archaeon]
METETGERGPSSPSPYSLAPTVKRRVFDWTFKAPWLVIAVSVVVFALLRLLSVDLPVTVRYLPLVLSVVFLGLPHGAVDYLVPARALGERVTLRWLGVVGVVYLIFGGVYTVAWYVLPFASAVFFVLMTWFHWGQGEIYPLVYVAEAEYVDDALQRYLVLAVRGGLPMAAPLVFFPEIYRRVIESFVSVFVSRPDVSYLVTTRMRVLVGALLATLTVASALRAYLSD